MTTLKRLKNGKYQVRWRDSGEKQRARNFPSRELAQEHLRALHRDEADDRARIPETTVGEIVARWKKDLYGGMSAGTRVRYDNLLRLHFASLLPLSIRDLTPTRINQWIDELKAAVATHRKAHLRTSFHHELTLLRVILGFYDDNWDDPHFVMPLKKRHRLAAKLRNRPPAKAKDLTEADFLRFRSQLEADYGVMIGTLATVQFYQAGRISEPAALRWEDVHFDWREPRRSRLTFSQHVVYARSKDVEDFIEPGLKNSEDGKEHPMLPEVFQALTRLWKPGIRGLVFADDAGEFLDYRYVQYRYNRAFEKVGLPYSSTHVMRHGGTRKTFDETGGDEGIAAQQLGNAAVVKTYAKRSVHAFTRYANSQWDRAEALCASGVHSGGRHLEIVKEN